jgi:hypothetical protein
MAWSDYESREWLKIQERKTSWLNQAEEDSWAARTGERFKDKADQAGSQLKRVPGVTKAGAALGTVAVKAQESLASVTTRTLSEKRLLKRYAKHGVAVRCLTDLRTLDLESLDRVVHKRKLDMRYGAVAGLEGAIAGLAVTGGTVTAGSGVGAAPGFGTVATAMAGDAGVMLALSSRVVADTAMHFGFDPDEPSEQLFMMSVINVGSAMTQGAKYAALSDLAKLTQALVRNAPWAQLSQHALSKVAAKFAGAFSQRLTKNKLGQLVPFVGVGVGLTMNYAGISSIQSAAYWAYRERLLLEKNPEAADGLTAIQDPSAPPGVDGEPVLEIEALVAEAAEEGEEA